MKATKVTVDENGRSVCFYAGMVLILWTAIIATSLVWSIHQQNTETRDEASAMARVAFDKDVLYRRWSAGHGGTYAPVTEKTPPNPYLSHLPERDITTPSGRKLTLVNPAYMTRQVHELGKEQHGVQGHITNLKPLSPENAPDAWETEALMAFERGTSEVSSVEHVDGLSTLRLMRPLVTEAGCLKCHASQRHKVGDIRGGISVSLPMEPLQAIANSHIRIILLGHAVIWFFGLLGLVVAVKHIRQKINEQQYAEEQLIVRSKQQSALAELGQKALQSNDLSTLFDDAVRLVSFEIDAEYCKILQHKPDENELSLQAGVGWKEGYVGRATVPDSSDSQAGYTLCQDKVVIVEDLALETRFDPSPLLTEHDVLSGMSVVIQGSGAPFGVLGVHSRKRRAFTEDDAHFFQAISNLLAVAIERQRAEKEIAQQANLLRAAIESLDHPFMVIDAENHSVQMANSAALRSAPSCANTCHAISHRRSTPCDGSEHPCPLIEVKQTGKPVRVEHVHYDNNGCERQIEVRAFPILDDNKRVVQIIEYYLDVTDRKLAEEKFQEAKEYTDNILSSMTDMLVVVSPEGRIATVNQAACDLLGYPENELIGQPAALLFEEEEEEEEEEDTSQAILSNHVLPVKRTALRRLVKEGSISNIEKLLLTKSGSRIPVLLSGAVMRDDQDEIRGIVCLALDITDCKQSEKEIMEAWVAVNESDERFMDVMLASKDAILLIDGETFVDCNDATVRMLGYSSRDEIQMLHPSVLSPPVQPDGHSSGEKANEMIETAFAEGRHRFEWMHRKENGEDFPVAVTLTAISIKGKRILHCHWHDLTETRRIEKRLKALSQAVEQNPATIVITDAQGTIEYVNPKFTETTGYTAKEAIGQNPRVLKSGEMSADEYKQLWVTITAGKTWHGEFHNKRKNGELYWESASISPIIDSKGSITRFLAIKEDITEAKRTQAALFSSEARYRTLYESSKDAIMTLTGEEGFISGNPATLGLFGCRSEEEFTSLSLGELSPERQPDGTLSSVEAQEMMALTMDKGSHFFEWTHKRVDGREFPATVLLVKMELDGKEVLQATVRDISEQKNIERELVQAQKLESIGQLSSGIAHEINTPTQFVGDNMRFLNDSIQNLFDLVEKYADLLNSKQGPLSWEERNAEIKKAIEDLDVEFLKEEIPNAIQQSLEGVDRIATIVGSMKEFAHPGVDDKQGANLNRAIESTITVARNEWKYAAEMETDFDPTLPLVPCLVSEFNQVILNMIINAAHAITDAVGGDSGKKGTISISTRHDDDWAEIRIRDTGTGIPDEIREKVFDPFFTTKEIGKGSGQGLAIARATIVKKHGGTLGVESEVGKGTTFIIRLPIEGETAKSEETDSHEEMCSREDIEVLDLNQAKP